MANPETRYPYPLSWPSGWRRTPAGHRKRAEFGRQVDRGGYRQKAPLSIADGRDRLLAELKRLGAAGVVISSDVKTRRDGVLDGSQPEPKDPGVAVYFTLKGKPRCFACDTWTRFADNLASIAGAIEALRSLDRYGVGNIEQAFAGYTAFLPAPAEEWHAVLGVPAHTPTADVKARYRLLAAQHHPDKGGDPNQMTRINQAYDAFCRERNL